MECTIESRSGELLSVPLSRLVASAYNVRKMGGSDVEDLKASIRAQGVLQNLIVCPAHDRKGRATGDYEVVGGQRRLRALQALAKEGEISKEEEILCRVKPTREAAEASLAENVARVAMHPADEFEAFKRLVDEGKGVEEVALRFGTSALTVRRRLRLAGLHPKLIALFREDGITLEQLMALAVSDDQDEQLSVWESVPEWQSDPATLRRMLVEQEIDAARDPLAKLVGLAAYEAAGGPVRRDLFDDEGAGYLQDEALLQRLASEKLDAAAEAVRAEGWSWVEVVPRLGASELFRFDRCCKTRRQLTKAEAKRHGGLEKRVAELDERLEWHFGGEDDLGEEALDALEREAEEAREALDTFEKGLEAFGDEAYAMAGAVISVGREGNIEVHCGLVRPGDRKTVARKSNGLDEGDEGGLDEPTRGPEEEAPRPAHSAALMGELTAQRTLAARAAMLEQPRVALVALVHCLAQRLLYSWHQPAVTAVRLVPNAPEAGLGGQASEQVRSCRAAELLAQAQERWGERMPGEPERLLPWLMALEDVQLHGLLALCVALSLNDVRDSERASPMDGLVRALSLDMAQWWEPTAAGYFSRVTKDTILAAIEEGAGADAAKRIKGVSKAELARVAERELQGKRWLPKPLHAPQGDSGA